METALAQEAGLTILAMVSGKPMTKVPDDLFIPPDALEVLLDSFTGPLDLLLYLIRRQNIDILDIPMAHITRQYLHYIELLELHRLELAADYLVMAAMLTEIKSRLLLPVHASADEDPEEDPRLALVRKLEMYEQFKEAAEKLDELPRYFRDIFPISLAANGVQKIICHPDVSLSALSEAMCELIRREGNRVHHQIRKEGLSVRERMAQVLERLAIEKTLVLTQLFRRREGRSGLAITFLAILELARESLLLITQIGLYGPVQLQAIDHD